MPNRCLREFLYQQLAKRVFKMESECVKNEKFTYDIASVLIAEVLMRQPNLRWLEKITTTDQKQYWISVNKRFHRIALCWTARSTFKDDPLKPDLDAGRISRSEYNLVWRSVAFFERLWALCQHTEPFIREISKQAKTEDPFDGAVGLFIAVLEEAVDSSFAECFTPYVELSRGKEEKYLRLIVKSCEGIQLTKEQAKFIRGRTPKTPVTEFLLDTAKKAAKNELIIKDALEDYHTATGRLCKCFATEWHNKGSFAWIRGHLVKGSKSSTYSL
jgi:hypothetical protein